MVEGAIPVARATPVMPPRPAARASVAAHSRRARSVKARASVLYFARQTLTFTHAAYRLGPNIRAFIVCRFLTVDIRGLTLIHVTRFVGAYFLVLHARGELPWAFAVPGGWGDIVVAAAALAVAALVPTRGASGWRILALWNVVGLVDIALVVATAARFAIADPASMGALTRLPLALLPTFLVPIIVWSHVVIFIRLAASRQAGYRTV